MARTDCLEVLYTRLDERRVIALGPDKAWAGGLGEGDAEPGLRHGRGDGFVKVLGCFYEMRLAEYQIAVGRDFECNGLCFHVFLPETSTNYYTYRYAIMKINFFGDVKHNV